MGRVPASGVDDTAPSIGPSVAEFTTVVATGRSRQSPRSDSGLFNSIVYYTAAFDGRIPPEPVSALVTGPTLFYSRATAPLSMRSGWRYRVVGFLGVAGLTALAVVLANTPQVQALVTAVPPLTALEPAPVPWRDLVDEGLTVVLVFLGALWPVFKPRSRRILDTVTLTEQRVFIAAATLATIGYFDWSIRPTRPTLIAATGLLAVVLPLWFVAIRRRPGSPTRAVVVGDDIETMELLHSAADVPVVGMVAPSNIRPERTREPQRARMTDGGTTPRQVPTAAELPRLGGLSQLETVLTEQDIDTALLGFEHTDRREFFGALAACHRHGVRALVHRTQADSVLVAGAADGELVDTDIDPWDWQDYAVKRAFDVGFATAGLLLALPVIAVVAVAVKLDSPGPLLYSQQRTAEFGETFTVYKFRSMAPRAEAETGARLSDEDAGDVDPRVTRVGRVLRLTHVDEIPQLWSILVGDMSVVGPRPERPELDAEIETAVTEWRSRWFVKPGLTGLAQINGVTGHEPGRKLRYDLEYIRKQSFWFDCKIVVRQLFEVGLDVVSLVTDDGRTSQSPEE